MKKKIPYILALIAVLNLIWLFGFDYRLPGFLTHTEKDTAQEQSAEVVSEQEEGENALEETAEDTSGQETQENVQETAADGTAENGQGMDLNTAEIPEPAAAQTEEETEEKTEEQPAPEETENERTCRSGEGNTPNIRSGPGTDYSIIRTAGVYEVMVVTGETVDGWVPIRTRDGVEGYVSEAMVDMQ